MTRRTRRHMGIELWVGWVPVRRERLYERTTWYFGIGRVWVDRGSGFWLSPRSDDVLDRLPHHGAD